MALNCRALRYIIIMVLKKMCLRPDSFAKFAMSYNKPQWASRFLKSHCYSYHAHGRQGVFLAGKTATVAAPQSYIICHITVIFCSETPGKTLFLQFLPIYGSPASYD